MVRNRRSSLLKLLSFAPFALASTSCGGGEGASGSPRPAVIQMLSGNDQEGVVGSQLPNPLMVEVLDARGRAVGGQAVAWSVVSGGGTLTPAVSTTNANGEARTFLRVGAAAGGQRVHATLGSLEPVVFEAKVRARPATQVVVAGGNGQSGIVASALAQPIAARVLDADGQPVAGAVVTFTVTAGGGSAAPTSAISDAAGQASTTWTLGPAAGTHSLSAGVLGVASPAGFTATASTLSAGPRTLEIVAGNNQSGTVSSVLANPLVVRLVDAANAPVIGAAVQFSTTVGGQLTPASATTNASGEATTSWRLGTTAGRQTVSVSATNAQTIGIQATGLAGAPSQLAIVSGNNQIGATGAQLPLPLVLRVTDAWDNAIENTQVTFAVTSGGGAIAPTTAMTGADGRVTAQWTLGPNQGANGASASVAGIGNAVLTATGAPPINMLAHRVVDAEYNGVIGKIITVSANPSRLHIIDPETKVVQTIDLAQVPNAVAVQPDGQFAAVGHNGWISYVDLTTRTVQRVYAVTTDVVDIVLPGNGWVHAFPRTDQWETIRSIALANGAETRNGTIRAGTLVRLHPSGRYIYGADNGLSPSDFEKYDIRNGAATVMYDSPYHGDYSFGGNVWISEDGLRLFARSGNAFRSSEVRAEDMLYAGNLSGMSVVQWVVQSTGAGRVFALPGTSFNSTAAAELRIYDSAFLAFRGTVPLPQFIAPGVGAFRSHGRFVFTNAAGTRVYVVLQADGSSGLALDWGWVAYSTSELP